MDVITQTIGEGAFKGTTFRCTDENPRRVSVLDLIPGACHISYDTARKRLKTLMGKDEQVRKVVSQYAFGGMGQRQTPVTTAAGLLLILTKMKGGLADQFRKEMTVLGARYFGGDTSINDEVNAIRQIQQQVPDNHDARLFGEAVESGQIGNLAGKTDDIRTVEWHNKRIESKDLTKAKAQAIKTCVPEAKVGDYIRNNVRICRAVTGLDPKPFKTFAGLPKSTRMSARDCMTAGQLGGVCMLEAIAKNIAGPGFEETFNKMAQAIEQVAKAGGLHGNCLPPPQKRARVEAAKTENKDKPAAKRSKKTAVKAIQAPAPAPIPSTTIINKHKNILNFFAPSTHNTNNNGGN